VDGALDTLTEEQLDLGPDSLCIAVETNEDRKLNASLMNSLRENARKRRYLFFSFYYYLIYILQVLIFVLTVP
jgi:hypothetical protein